LGLRISVFFQPEKDLASKRTIETNSTHTITTGTLNDTGFQDQLEQITAKQAQELSNIGQISVQELSKIQKESSQTSSTQALKQIFETTKDSKVLSLLIQKLVADFQYDEAYQLSQNNSG
jgi:hypothetical protein